VKLTKEEFGEWKHQPVTEKVLKVLAGQREVFSDALLNGATLCGHRTAEETAKAVGIIYGVDLLLQMEVDDE